MTTELMRFGVVGLLATATHVGLFYGFMLGLGVEPALATTLAFLCALTVSYTLNRSWTFRAPGRHGRHFPRFVAIALGGAGLNAAIMRIGTLVLGWPPSLCLLVIIAVVPGLSFLVQKHWGFR